MSFISENMLSILITCLVILIYLLIKKRLVYFSNKGIPYVKPSFLDVFKIMSVTNFVNRQIEIYRRECDKGNSCVGIFQTFLKPSILVLDPALVENILIKDFSHFHDHGIDVDTKAEPLNGHLFHMQGDQWRTLRNKLLPTFTSGKLKGMIPIMNECSHQLISSMKQDNKILKDVKLKEIFHDYSLSFIASCVFAIDPESIKDPNNEFRQFIKTFRKPTKAMTIRTALHFLAPKVAKLLRIKLISKEVDDFFINVTKDAIETRKNSGIKRNDFIQLLLELKEKGSVQVDVRDLEEDEKRNIKQAAESETFDNKLEITYELLAAQTFVFIVAGFENTAYLAATAAYLLSKHKDVQQRVREEVREALSKHGGMNYLALKDMKLLDGAINESLRMYPAATFLLRKCNKHYSLSNGITVEKGMTVVIPTKAFQMDSKYWPDPDKFDPERFLNADIKPGTYLPFGDGPRICIAQRLALLMVKILLAEIIVHFEMQPSSKNKEPLQQLFLTSADFKGGLWGSFQPLHQ